MKKNALIQLKKLVLYAMVAAIYAATSLALAPISFGGVQFRISEALTLLPVFMPEAVIGVTLGCAITNLIGVALGVNILGILDVFIGTAATLIAALMTRSLRKIRIGNVPWAAALPPILINAIFIGVELAVSLMEGFQWNQFWPLFGSMALSVGIGQSGAILVGIPLVIQLEKRFGNKFENMRIR